MTFEELEDANENALRKEAQNCFNSAQEMAGGSWDRRVAKLIEAQFYMQERDRRDSAKVSRRDFRLELIVIALIGLEIVIAIAGTVIGIREGNAQGKLLQSTAATLTSLQSTMETMNRAIQRQAGALSEVSVDMSYYNNAITITNTGQTELAIISYQFDGRRGPKLAQPVSLPRGDSYKVSAEPVVLELQKLANVDPKSADMPFRISLRKKDGTEFSAEVTLYATRIEDGTRIGYGPTFLTRHDWTAPQKR